MKVATIFGSLLFIVCVNGHGHRHAVEDKAVLESKWGEEWPFMGFGSFAKLPYTKCLTDPDVEFDIGIIGVPFDTAVSYRTGARFGPKAIRQASQRQNKLRGYNFRAGINPYQDWAKVIDCGDIPVTPMDNKLAFEMMTAGYENLLSHKTSAVNLHTPPRLVSLGGDHSILLPILRNMHKHYGRVAVIHFDSHMDTWAPSNYPSFWHSEQSELNHGSMLWKAHEEGLILETGNVHAGLRSRLSGFEDYEQDSQQGFHRIESDELMDIGVEGVLERIKQHIPEGSPVYISVDIDVLDPSAAPGTGTMEAGGWLTRELIAMIRGLEDMNIVGADIVEVAPAYDPLEITSLAASQIAYELITNMVKRGPLKPKHQLLSQ